MGRSRIPPGGNDIRNSDRLVDEKKFNRPVPNSNAPEMPNISDEQAEKYTKEYVKLQRPSIEQSVEEKKKTQIEKDQASTKNSEKQKNISKQIDKEEREKE